MQVSSGLSCLECLVWSREPTGKLEHSRSRDDDGKSMWDDGKISVVIIGVVFLDHPGNGVR